MTAAYGALVVLGLLTVSACGARTQLDTRSSGGTAGVVATGAAGAGRAGAGPGGEAGAAGTGQSPAVCASDKACDDNLACTVDRCGPNGCTNTPQASLCNDGYFCTVDECVVGKGCVSTKTPALCDDGIACTVDACNEVIDACEHDACDEMCEDEIFCNGVERCDAALGCVTGKPTCMLGLPCSKDTCDEVFTTCSHDQTPSCAPGVLLLTTDQFGGLDAVSPYTGAVTHIADSGAAGSHLDIAILGGRWFALNFTAFVELSPYTNDVKKSFPAVDGNSLAAGPDGFLYSASTQVNRIDPETGLSSVVAQLPAGSTSSGDIAFLRGRMFVSTDGPCGGGLAEIDLPGGVGTILGGDGLGCVYGLAAAGDTLFVVNCDGTIGTFDPDTGSAQILSTSSVSVYGADTLP